LSLQRQLIHSILPVQWVAGFGNQL
jgi:hypothetical protein